MLLTLHTPVTTCQTKCNVPQLQPTRQLRQLRAIRNAREHQLLVPYEGFQDPLHGLALFRDIDRKRTHLAVLECNTLTADLAALDFPALNRAIGQPQLFTTILEKHMNNYNGRASPCSY